MPKRDRPQRGNPNQLVTNQHVMPVASIRRFCGDDGRVDVWIHKAKAQRLRPDNPIFCAVRGWDERYERHHFKRIEDAYQRLAPELERQTSPTLSRAQSELVNRYFALCYLRARHKAAPLPDFKMDVQAVRVDYSVNSLEHLEKNGYIAIHPDGSLPGRAMTGPMIQLRMHQLCQALARHQWLRLSSAEAEFIVPDLLPEVGILPLSPRTSLCIGTIDDPFIHPEAVRDLNRRLLSCVVQYYFARNLANCPL